LIITSEIFIGVKNVLIEFIEKNETHIMPGTLMVFKAFESVYAVWR
jgi:hypothetical protein